MVNALTSRADEGRGVSAISPGEVTSDLWPGDVRMWQHNVEQSMLCVSNDTWVPAEVNHLSKRRKIKQSSCLHDKFPK